MVFETNKWPKILKRTLNLDRARRLFIRDWCVDNLIFGIFGGEFDKIWVSSLMGCLAQLVEHPVYIGAAGGSSPSTATT